MTPRAQVGDLYRSTRVRTQSLLGALDAEQWSLPVPACPGWDVHAVLAHLVGVIEDSAGGRLDGPPGPEQTAEEVARHGATPPAELLRRWTELSPDFEALVTSGSIWPAFFDVLSHEHDVHGALGSRGDRDSDEVRLAAKLLARSIDLGRPVRIDTGSGVLTTAVDGEDPLVLRASSFEVVRFRLGRRSREQVLAMDWSEDPGDLVDRLFVFGPAVPDLVE
jgi:uncharacterized protein (TIGR03083 family)